MIEALYSIEVRVPRRKMGRVGIGVIDDESGGVIARNSLKRFHP